MEYFRDVLYQMGPERKITTQYPARRSFFVTNHIRHQHMQKLRKEDPTKLRRPSSQKRPVNKDPRNSQQTPKQQRISLVVLREQTRKTLFNQSENEVCRRESIKNISPEVSKPNCLQSVSTFHNTIYNKKTPMNHGCINFSGNSRLDIKRIELLKKQEIDFTAKSSSLNNTNSRHSQNQLCQNWIAFAQPQKARNSVPISKGGALRHHRRNLSNIPQSSDYDCKDIPSLPLGRSISSQKRVSAIATPNTQASTKKFRNLISLEETLQCPQQQVTNQANNTLWDSAQDSDRLILTPMNY